MDIGDRSLLLDGKATISKLTEHLDKNEELKGIGYIFTLFLFILIAVFIKKKDKKMVYPGVGGYILGIIIGSFLDSSTFTIIFSPIIGFLSLLISALIINIKNGNFQRSFESNRTTRGSFWSGSSVWDKRSSKNSDDTVEDNQVKE